MARSHLNKIPRPQPDHEVTVTRAPTGYDGRCAGHSTRVPDQDFRGNPGGDAVEIRSPIDRSAVSVEFNGQVLATRTAEQWNELFEEADAADAELSPDQRLDLLRGFCKKEMRGAVDLYLEQLKLEVKFGNVPLELIQEHVPLVDGNAVASSLKSKSVTLDSDAVPDLGALVRSAAAAYAKAIKPPI
jgi:hypothetical protein